MFLLTLFLETVQLFCKNIVTWLQVAGTLPPVNKQDIYKSFDIPSLNHPSGLMPE